MVEVLVDWGTEEAGLGFGGGEAMLGARRRAKG